MTESLHYKPLDIMPIDSKTYNKKFIIEYLVSGIICLIFALWIDVRFGLSFLVIFMILPVVSLLMIHGAVRHLEVNIHTINSVLSKKDSLVLETHVTCNSFIMFAFLKICFFEDFHLQTHEPTELLLPLGRKLDEKIIRNYMADISGPVQIGIQKMEMADFLGLCSYSFQNFEPKDQFSQTLEILPNIPKLTGNELLRESIEASIADDEEETESKHTFAASSMPGFEHREYVPGDSLKRINWKLSSKQDIYMVRLDEPVSKIKQNIIINYSYPDKSQSREEIRQGILDQERVIESTLAIAELMMKQHLECNIYYFLNQKWHLFVLKTPEDILTIQYTLSRHQFLSNRMLYDRMPDIIQKNIGSILIFTVSVDQELCQYAEQFRHLGNQIKIITTRKPMAQTTDMWKVDSTFEFVKI